MESARITSKGQITVPRAVLERLGLRPGDRLLFCEQPDGTIMLGAASHDVMALAGSIAVGVKGITVDGMNDAVRKGASSGIRLRRRT